MSTNTTESPITVTVDYDPRGVSVGVWQGSHCIYSGAHPLPSAPGASTAGNPQPARDWELTCHECDGSGHVYVKHQVAERKTDIQEFKQECECCEGRGFVFAFQDIPGIDEYVKACRPAPAAAGVSTVEEKANPNGQNVGQIVDDYIQEYELRGEDEEGRDGVYSPNETERYMIADAIYGLLAEPEFITAIAGMHPAPAAGDALDAARYRQLRKALTSYDTGWLDRIAAALEAMGLDPDEDKLPTPEQVDGAFDAAQRKGDA